MTDLGWHKADCRTEVRRVEGKSYHELIWICGDECGLMPSIKPWNNYVMVCNTCYERWEGQWGEESLQTARRQCTNCLRDLMEGIKIIPKEKYNAIV